MCFLFHSHYAFFKVDDMIGYNPENFSDMSSHTLINLQLIRKKEREREEEGREKINNIVHLINSFICSSTFGYVGQICWWVILNP